MMRLPFRSLPVTLSFWSSGHLGLGLGSRTVHRQRNWGPQLQFMATSNSSYARDPGKKMGTTRGRCVRLDCYGARPSAVDSVRGGDCVAATGAVANGPEIMGFKRLYSSFTI